MNLQILGSSSAGNGYILKCKDGSSLIIECGIPLKEVKKALDFDLSKVVAALCTHEHGDHAKYAKDYANAGIDIFSAQKTLDKLKLSGHRIHELPKTTVWLSGFKVLAFPVKHDAVDPIGLLIQHESNTILFLTDTHYCPYKFKGLNQVIIEANFSEEILQANIDSGLVNQTVGNRSRTNHMSLEILKDLLQANDLTQVNNICLIHLSSNNSDPKRFQKEITELTGKNVSVAVRGMEIDFSKTPF